MSSSRFLLAVALSASLLLSACGGDDEASVPAEESKAVATTYADLVSASYDASIASAITMQTAIDAFTSRPSATRLATARKAWLAARDDYVPTEAFRFYGGPIDDPKDGPEGKINAWPMDEAYVDYVKGSPNAGIVGDAKRYPKITRGVILEANERGGETNISSGWHAIEFLLWGQDQSKTGPGNRPVSDYASGPNAKRRGAYLRLATTQLLADLTSVRDQWTTRGGQYRSAFLADPSRALTNIMRGIGALTAHELAGERMAVAFESKDQEDEHSCFSDNTNADVVNDIKGVRMTYLAEFPGVSGASLDSIVAKEDPELAKRLRTELDGVLAKAEAFPATFETMIAAADGSPENKAMGDAITALEKLGDTFAEAANALGVKVKFQV